MARTLVAVGPDLQTEMRLMPFNPPARGAVIKVAQVAIPDTSVMRTGFVTTGTAVGGVSATQAIRPTPDAPPVVLAAGKASAAVQASSLTPSSAVWIPYQPR